MPFRSTQSYPRGHGHDEALPRRPFHRSTRAGSPAPPVRLELASAPRQSVASTHEIIGLPGDRPSAAGARHEIAGRHPDRRTAHRTHGWPERPPGRRPRRARPPARPARSDSAHVPDACAVLRSPARASSLAVPHTPVIASGGRRSSCRSQPVGDAASAGQAAHVGERVRAALGRRRDGLDGARGALVGHGRRVNGTSPRRGAPSPTASQECAPWQDTPRRSISRPFGPVALATCHVLPFQISVNPVTSARYYTGQSPRTSPVTAQFAGVAHDTPGEPAGSWRRPPRAPSSVSVLPFHEPR